MKTPSSIRPCAEFPCDNPRLYSNYGRAGEVTGAPPEVEVQAPTQPELGRANEFDWLATDHWVQELKRRWSAAKIDAPNVHFPVLDAMALESTTSIARTSVVAMREDALVLEEGALLTESGVMLGELLVLPSETVFDGDEHVFTASALGLELAETTDEAGEPWLDLESVGHVESGEVPLVHESGVEAISVELAFDDDAPSSVDGLDAETDPFIEELLGLVPNEVNVERARAPKAMPLPLLEDFDGFGEARDLPAVASSDVCESRAAVTELCLVPRGVQPLVPLQLELTPTPAATSPWTELTNALSRHLMNSGHTRSSALLAPLMCGELVDLSRIDAVAIERLIRDGVAETRGGRVVTTATFRHSAKAFREEFSAGGLNAEDALFWLSQLLVGLCGGAADEETLESELRDLGVAKLLEWAA